MDWGRNVWRTMSNRFTRAASPHIANPMHDTEQGEKRPMKGEDMFEVFLPLIKPLSGAVSMELLSMGDQKIMLIGEYHQKKYCKQLGFTPLSSIILDYLDTAQNVDFMIEMANSMLYDDRLGKSTKDFMNSYSKMKLQTKEDTNDPSWDQHPETIMNQTRLLVAPFVNNPKGAKNHIPKFRLQNRVHYIDVDFVHEIKKKNDRLFNLFAGSLGAYTTRMKLDQIVKINQLFLEIITEKEIEIDVRRLPWVTFDNYPDLMQYDESQQFRSESDDGKRLFVTLCIELLAESKFFVKCFGDEDRHVRTEDYVDVFFTKSIYGIDISTLQDFYFHLQRLFVDIYTTCRIKKKSLKTAPWYKNIVVYAGVSHTFNLSLIFQKLGYEKHAIKGMVYNPFCDPKGPSAVPGAGPRGVGGSTKQPRTRRRRSRRTGHRRN